MDSLEIKQSNINKKVIGLEVINKEEKSVQDEFLDALKSKNADYFLWTVRHKPDIIHKLKPAA